MCVYVCVCVYIYIYIYTHYIYVLCARAQSFFMTLWTVANQAPLSIGFSKQEYWSGLPCPPPGDLPNPGTEPMSPALQVDSLLLSHWESPIYVLYIHTVYMCVCMCVCVCDAILLSHKKNENLPFATTWMDLERIMFSEMSQKRKTNTV